MANSEAGASVDGRVAVVTGAGSGLGRNHALSLARAGARVVVNDIARASDGACAAERVAAEIIEAGGQAIAVQGSVASWHVAEDLIERAVDVFGRVDVVVANAGILSDSTVPEMSEQAWREVIDVNLSGTFSVVRAAWPHMADQHHGRLVLTTSASGIFGNRGHANYGASKAGVLGLMRMLAVEGAEFGICANAIAPLALTPMSSNTAGARTSASGVLGGLFDHMASDDVSPLVVWLSGDESSATGQVFSIGGGRIARVFIGEGQGVVVARSPSVDDIRRNIDSICDVRQFSEPSSMSDELSMYAEALLE